MPDVIIIGAGGGGPVAAKELAAHGVEVLLLEAGPHETNPERNWSRYENDANNPTTGYLRYGPGDRFEKPNWFRDTPQNSFIWQLSGVGGTTQHYYGNNPRALPGVFEDYDAADKNEYDIQHRFPFGYRSFLPYYEWVEETLPVQTAAMGRKERLFFKGAAGAGLPLNRYKDVTKPSFRPQENAILQPRGTAGKTEDPSKLRYPQAQGCTFCGYCFQGCIQPKGAPRNLKAKRSTDNSYVPMCLTADAWSSGGKAVKLVANAYVTRILTSGSGDAMRASGVEWRDTQTGERHTETAKVIVMAGGCTENPRLWLNSGLPNPNDWVGRGYTDHFFDWCVGVFDEPTGNSAGVGSSARVDIPGKGGLENVGLPPALEGFAFTLSDSGIRGHYGNGRGMTGPWDGPAGRPIGNELKEMMSNIDHLLNVLIITDDDVEPQNRVLQSSLNPDENGPIPKVVFKHRKRSKRTLANREYLNALAVKLLRAAGAKKVIRVDWAPLILHVQSSMRMGSDAGTSVLDSNCQARAVKQLYITDNSALANGIGGPNPTLTTQALATRTAEHILVAHFGGSPYVVNGSPVSSIDDVVTRAVQARGIT
jgi:choline dehydrogenase-like flavoprotein